MFNDARNRSGIQLAQLFPLDHRGDQPCIKVLAVIVPVSNIIKVSHDFEQIAHIRIKLLQQIEELAVSKQHHFEV